MKNLKMIPSVNLENLQKPMQKHHLVVKGENYNLYCNDTAKNTCMCLTLHALHHILPGKKNTNGLSDIDGLCLLFVTIFLIKS